MSQQSAPYKMNEMLYKNHAEDRGLSSSSEIRRINTKLGCIDSDTDSSELHVKLLLRGIAETLRIEGHNPWPDIQPIGRIEIICDDHTEAARYRRRDRGIVLFDLNGQPLIHVVNALVGYSGSGPSLTEAIFRELRIDHDIFDEIQQAYQGVRSTNIPCYVVIQSVRDDKGQFKWHWSSVWESASQ